jgi:hypothetical protein
LKIPSTNRERDLFVAATKIMIGNGDKETF